MTELWLADDPAVLRARGSLKWTATRGEIAAWVAESDLGTAPAVTRALHEAVDLGLTGYLPPALRSGVARSCAELYARRYGADVTAAEVRIVADVVTAMRLTLDRLVAPGAPVALPTPAYMPFVSEPAGWGHDAIQVPMVAGSGGRAELDLEGIEAALASGAGLVVLVNPHNPTGRVYTTDELRALSEVVAEHDAWVFADEVHAPLVHGGRRHVPYATASAAARRHTITATAASKAWNVAGLKCAQVLIGDPEARDRWDAGGDTAEGASTLGAVATVAGYEHGEPWLEQLCGYVEANGALLGQVLAAAAPAVGYREPEGTYLAWLDLRAALPADARELPPGELGAWLRAASGVTVVDGAKCGEVGHGWVRLNLAMPAPLVEQAARRIAAALAG
ncbi:aminotransferase class I/II-fold pyridoxal phosphate-dependent enzyme [Actinotalea sp. M2MS4P-6]|uniref:MalY/PatB family protein n=1 Tax=Actinotalea sp. M2MS4P-6 TaxID=2983762 RepID=UPI0021E483D3|nr:aminotransferase class I/II-fold pyridoxal phosphate-dependent enzyme [Actinotalea sp. M2MS4P-6]MCV2394107.1 aminotransferase class I/II-fold pyridoxal phosphate-dependent enzyme [Actinotalea sp. M2MS4P-6]